MVGFALRAIVGVTDRSMCGRVRLKWVNAMSKRVMEGAASSTVVSIRAAYGIHTAYDNTVNRVNV